MKKIIFLAIKAFKKLIQHRFFGFDDFLLDIIALRLKQAGKKNPYLPKIEAFLDQLKGLTPEKQNVFIHKFNSEKGSFSGYTVELKKNKLIFNDMGKKIIYDRLTQSVEEDGE